MAETIIKGPRLNTPFAHLYDDVEGYQMPVVKSDGAGGGAGGPDREIVVNTFHATTAFTGASVGDVLTQMRVLDLTGTDPVQVGATIWFNDSTQLALASAPSAANIEPLGAAGVTNAQMVAALSTQTASINGTVLTNAQEVAALATQTGVKTTAASALPAGGSGILGWLSRIWTDLTAQLPAALGRQTVANSLSVVQATTVSAVSLLAAQAIVGAGSNVTGVAATKTYTVSGITTAGAGAASVVIEGAQDNSATIWETIATINLTLINTAAVAESFTSIDRFRVVRGRLVSISGTGASVDSVMTF